MQPFRLFTLLCLTAGLSATVNESLCSRYKGICENHTMCKYRKPADRCGTIFNSGLKEAEKQAAVDAHNKVRSIVALGKESRGNPGPQPSAASMNNLVWDEELSKVAQQWANQCKMGHDKCRHVPRFHVGQNVFIQGSTRSQRDVKEEWFAAVKAWHDEVRYLSSSLIGNYKTDTSTTTGHYTQVVWANTSTVGCGVTSYMSGKWKMKLYVCNYGPSGNYIGDPVYEPGSPCSKCKTKCVHGLCL